MFCKYQYAIPSRFLLEFGAEISFIGPSLARSDAQRYTARPARKRSGKARSTRIPRIGFRKEVGRGGTRPYQISSFLRMAVEGKKLIHKIVFHLQRSSGGR